jgi:hypothetical protein
MPYRAPSEGEKRAPAPRELAQDVGSGTAPIVGFVLAVLLFGAILGGVRGSFAPTMAVTGVVAVAVALFLRRVVDNGIVFAVDGESLAVRRGRRRGKILLRLPLEDLLDVKLDTVEMANPTVSFSASPGFGQGGSMSASHDESRVVLYPRGAEPFPLTERYGSVTVATDWAAEIRRFLRAHGWLPLDERGDEVNTEVDAGEAEEKPLS